jgi:hypothetical protein
MGEPLALIGSIFVLLAAMVSRPVDDFVARDVSAAHLAAGLE